MSLLDRLTPKIHTLINRIGRPAVLRTYPNAVDDSVQGENSLGTPVDYDVIITPLLNYNRALIDGDSIRMGDCYVLAGELPVVPQTMMEFLVDGKPWKVVSVKVHSPGETTAAYEIQLRAGGE